jgi:hypothetical protein
LAALALGVVPAGCGRSPSRSGSVDVVVTTPAEVGVETFVFEVSGNGIAPLTGVAHFSEPQHLFEKLINGVPAGTGYDLVVSAKSVDGQFVCDGSTKVNVHQNAVTRVLVALSCISANVGGNVVVAVSGNIVCPGAHLADYVVSPLTTSVGDPISVSATASPPDAATPTYAWSAPSGTFDDPSSPQTTYHCGAAGNIMLNVHAVARGCSEDQSIEVTCLGPSQDAAAN